MSIELDEETRQQVIEHGIDTDEVRKRLHIYLRPESLFANKVLSLCDALDRQQEETARLRADLANYSQAFSEQRDKALAQLDRIEALCEPDLINPEAGCSVDSRKIRAILNERI